MQLMGEERNKEKKEKLISLLGFSLVRIQSAHAPARRAGARAAHACPPAWFCDTS
jgi:hypothetical protein